MYRRFLIYVKEHRDCHRRFGVCVVGIRCLYCGTTGGAVLGASANASTRADCDRDAPRAHRARPRHASSAPQCRFLTQYPLGIFLAEERTHRTTPPPSTTTAHATGPCTPKLFASVACGSLSSVGVSQLPVRSPTVCIFRGERRWILDLPSLAYCFWWPAGVPRTQILSQSYRYPTGPVITP